MGCQWCANPETIDPYPQLLFYKNKCTGCGRCVASCAYDAIEYKAEEIVQLKSKCKNCGECVRVCRDEARELNGKIRTPEEVFKIVDQDKVFYEQSGGGVTFSGGEPMLHTEFIQKVASMCKEAGYSVAIETCGNFCLQPVLKIMDVVDYLLFDIKIIDEEKHIKYCGKSNKKIHRNFEALMDKAEIIPRVPIIPSVNDSPVDIALLCKFFSQYKGELKKIHILPYHNLGLGKYDALCQHYLLNDIKPPADEDMEKIKRDLENCGFEVEIGG